MASAAAAAAAIVLLPGRQTLPATMMSFSRRLNGPVFRSVTSCSYSTSFASRKQLILYSKPGCCLCDGLKEKLHSAFSLASPSPDSYSLHDVELQVRDITSNPEWERAYQYEIPVLARLRSDGTEVGWCFLELNRQIPPYSYGSPFTMSVENAKFPTSKLTLIQLLVVNCLKLSRVPRKEWCLCRVCNNQY
ncbi:Glutaredoxin-like protein, partial [Cynara cardunculus var. scolymus]